MRKVRALGEIAAARGQSLAAMAVSWLLKDEDVASVIIGASSAEQIRQNLCVNSKFSEQECKAIEDILGKEQGK